VPKARATTHWPGSTSPLSEQLLEDEQDGGRGAVAAVGQHLVGAGHLGVAEAEAPLHPVDDLGTAGVDGPVGDVGGGQAVRPEEVLHQAVDLPLDQGRDPWGEPHLEAVVHDLPAHPLLAAGHGHGGRADDGRAVAAGADQRGRRPVAEQGQVDRVLARPQGLHMQGAQLHAGDQGAPPGRGRQRRRRPQRRQGRVAAHVADGQTLDPPVERQVGGQVGVQPGAAVAGAGDGQQVADLGGRVRPGPLQGPPGRLGPQPAGGRGEDPHAVGGAPGPGQVAQVDHRRPPLHPGVGEHLGPGRVPSGLAGEEVLDRLRLLEHVVRHGRADGLDPSGHGPTFR
jgi:hypothetical protein